jgi:hypothetical protein
MKHGITVLTLVDGLDDPRAIRDAHSKKIVRRLNKKGAG